MAKRNGNRDRRAAKAQRRAGRRVFVGTQGTGSGTTGAGWWVEQAAAPRYSPEMISTMLLSAAREQWAGDPNAGSRMARQLGELFADQSGMLAAAARCAVTPLVGAVWANGWSLEDLYQITRRRLDASAVSYTVDAIAEESQQYAAAGLHERWRDQLQQVEATVWWEPGQGHLTQWARRHGRSLSDALVTVINVLELLMSLPRVPTIVPPPGSAPTHRPRRGVDQKVLARVRGLLAKAESTTFPEEAEALSAKAQELMSRYSLERIVVEATPGSDQEPAAARRLWLDSPYVAAKSMLVSAVAKANRCRTVLSEKLGFITVIGDEVDLEIVELLSTSLLVQATRAMVSAGSQITKTGQSRTRSFRQSFLIAYATRIGERLSTARDAGAAAVSDQARLLPVLAARERMVDDLFESLYPESVSRSFSVGNAAGWYAGRAAADLAVLDTGPAVTAGGS
ncbi:MAG: DUF2786 domain-containing protein [Pseudonocardiaceae bacterium]